MIKLRLQRRGRKKRPFYHLVVADQRFPRDGRIIERLGRFDNVSENKQLTLDEERIIHWLQIGAKPSDTVRSILKQEGIMYKLHLLRWGKSEEEIEQALQEWRENKATAKEDKKVSRKERQKALLEAEEKEYKKQLEEKAAEAARQAKIKKAEEEAEAKAQAEEAVAEEEEEKVKAETEASAGETTAEPEAAEEPEAEAKTESEPEAEVKTEEPEAETKTDEVEAEDEEEVKTEEAGAEKEEVKAEEVEEETSDEEEPKAEASAEKAPEQVSTDMNANEAIDHIKNTPLEELKGFVPDDEERVTVQRAWESKQSD